MQNILGSNIRRLRKQKRVTQEALAREFGFTAQLVSQWELGDCNPDILLLPELAHYFGVTVDTLLSRDPSVVETKIRTDRKQNARQRIAEAWRRLDDEIVACAGLNDPENSVFTAEERIQLIEKQQKIFRAVFGEEDSADCTAYEEQFCIRLAKVYALLGETEKAMAHLERSAGMTK